MHGVWASAGRHQTWITCIDQCDMTSTKAFKHLLWCVHIGRATSFMSCAHQHTIEYSGHGLHASSVECAYMEHDACQCQETFSKSCMYQMWSVHSSRLHRWWPVSIGHSMCTSGNKAFQWHQHQPSFPASLVLYVDLLRDIICGLQTSTNVIRYRPRLASISYGVCALTGQYRFWPACISQC